MDVNKSPYLMVCLILAEMDSYWTKRQLVTSVEFKKMEYKIQRFEKVDLSDYRRGPKLVA